MTNNTMTIYKATYRAFDWGRYYAGCNDGLHYDAVSYGTTKELALAEVPEEERAKVEVVEVKVRTA